MIGKELVDIYFKILKNQGIIKSDSDIAALNAQQILELIVTEMQNGKNLENLF